MNSILCQIVVFLTDLTVVDVCGLCVDVRINRRKDRKDPH